PVTLKNDGLIDATVSLGGAPAGFSVSGLPVTLHPGDTTAASVKFAPTAAPPAGGNVTLNVASSAGNGTSSFAVTGTGVAAGTSVGTPYTAVPPTRILDTR